MTDFLPDVTRAVTFCWRCLQHPKKHTQPITQPMETSSTTPTPAMVCSSLREKMLKGEATLA